ARIRARRGGRRGRPRRRSSAPVMRPRVLHVVVAGEMGGAERVVLDLATHPAETGADHAVLLFTPNARLRALFLEASITLADRGRVREGPLAYLWRSLGPIDLRWAARQARRIAPHLIVVHTFASQVLGTRLARKLGARLLRTEHSTRVYVDPSC